ncbi:MAG: VanZ family protein [Deltaproteobacteria bacterium]|nr:VanZ family protein [Deltaproteobacteria bacterium]
MRVLALLYVALLLAIVALADLGAIGPIVRVVHAVPCLDKVAHFGFATLLGAIIEAATRSRGRALAIVTPVVLLEELSQRWVPGRTFDLLDLAADGAGLALGTWLVVRLGRAALTPLRPS